MNHTYRITSTVTLLTLWCFLFVVGCSFRPAVTDTGVSTAKSNSNETDIRDAETDPDLEDMDDELIALSKTGIWNSPSPQVSHQPFSSVTYDLPIVQNKQVSMYLNLFQNSQRKQFKRWLSRLTIYRPLVQDELNKAGIPNDLIYLAMIESGFNPRAKSRSRAVGLWQFMQGTGRQYNLKIDKYVDERRDPIKSTQAAVDYLSDLYKEFGDWYLAVAAYNAGPGKIRYGLKKFKVDNFWDLAAKPYLSIETKRYVPKLIATMLIAKQPEKYGFTNILKQKPPQFDSIKVGPGMNLEAIAMISKTSLKTIKELNLELRQNRTPLNVDEYEVNIPESTAALAQKNISRLHSVVTTGYMSHRVQKGDTLSSICRLYNINKTTLLKVNNLRRSTLVTGRTLRIPYNRISYRLLPEGKGDAMAAYRESLVLHTVVKGDTLSRISRQYQVPTELIVAWNGLKSKHTIRAGQQLALYIDHASSDKNVHSKMALNANATNYIYADKQKSFPEDDDTLFHWYQVRHGDTLWTISRKFRSSTADIKRWNPISSTPETN